MTYRELNERSNQLAHYLRDNYDIRPDDLVGFQLARDENMIMAILAILKSGAGYIPIDIDSPVEKISHIANDSNCLLIIDENKLEGVFCQKLNVSKNKFGKRIRS